MSSTTSTRPVPWYRRTWVLIAATAVICLGVGAAAGGTSDPKSSPEYKAQVKKLKQANDDLDVARQSAKEAADKLAAAEGDMPAREAAVAKAQADLDGRERAVTAAEAAAKETAADLKKREKAVGIAEDEAAANTIPGEGVYRVGSDMNPGTYKSNDNADCYWMISSDANGDNILSNNIVTGPAFVTVKSGQYFTTQGCSEWTKAG